MDRAFVLAGGQGMRLRPFTTILPKPLIPLGERSILERLLSDIERSGIRDVTVSLGYLGHLVEAVIGDGSALGLSVTYTREKEPLGTAGALALMPGEIDDDDVILVVNGDTLTSLDFGATLQWFRSTGTAAGMICAKREVAIDYGVVEFDGDGNLVTIHEKPKLDYIVSVGINLLRGSTVRLLPPGRVDMPDFLLGLRDAGHDVACQVMDGLWMDLGRPEDLVAANELIARGDL
jgi:NDP-sugar pyrophosphorylase family protein